MRVFYRETAYLVLLMFCACSSSNGLKKFDEGDLAKEISVDAARKFEVRDIGAPTPVPAPSELASGTSKKGKNKKKKRGKEESSKMDETTIPPMRRTDPVPFEVGENLEYSIRYIGVTAGYLNLEVLPFKQLIDRKVFHLQATAKTATLFELVYRVNDLVESFYDFDGLYSHKFTMDLDESKQTRKLVELYDYDKHKSFYWNRINHVEKGISEKKESYDIPSWCQDPLSALYFLRTAKLPTEPGPEFRFPVILDGRPWESVLHFEKTATIYAGGKDREANVYHMDNYQNGELKNKENTLWISTDEHHYILRVETKVKVGSFAVALDKVL